MLLFAVSYRSISLFIQKLYRIPYTVYYLHEHSKFTHFHIVHYATQTHFSLYALRVYSNLFEFRYLYLVFFAKVCPPLLPHFNRELFAKNP